MRLALPLALVVVCCGANQLQAAPRPLKCVGFNDPISADMTIGRGRVLPLKFSLLDASDGEIRELKTAPVVRLQTRTADSTEPVDAQKEVLANDFGDGHSFVFAEDFWKFDLNTESLRSGVTYVASVGSGKDRDYSIDPSCSVTFQIRGN